MRPVEIENWALNVIHQVDDGQPNEDSRVELKAEWIDTYKAARQMAGHANAARGDPILWLVGVDQQSGPVGVDHKELAEWLSQVSSHFEGASPQVIDINIPHQGKTVVALFMETDRAPFVVENPEFGDRSGVVIACEVPWREGTTTRTATRSDLIRLLVPRLALPEMEIIDAKLVLSKHDKYRWYLEMQLYAVPNIDASIVIPFHRCQVRVELVPPGIDIDLSSVRIVPPYKPVSGPIGAGWEPDSVTAAHTNNELLLGGPSRVDLSAECWSDEVPVSLEGSSAHVVARLAPAHTDQKLTIARTLRWKPSDERGALGQWKLD